MRRVSILLLLLVVPLALEAEVAPSRVQVLMISIDGLRPGDILAADERGVSIPNLRKLMDEGVTADGVVGVLPSVTYPSHVTLITGVPPRIHGIASNHVLDVEDIGQDPWYWFAEDIRVPTLIDAAEAKGLVTASISWPVTVGLSADYLMPEFWRGWSSHPFDRRFMVHLSSPGLLDAVGRTRGKPIPSFSEMTDRDRIDVARWVITSAEPDLMLVHIFDLDFAEHEWGPGSPRALKTLEASDALVGELLEALETAGLRSSTVVVVVSDHGFLPVHSGIAPNTALVADGLIRLDDDGRVAEWDAYFLCDNGSAALVLHDPEDIDVLTRVDRLVSAKAKEPGSGIFRVLRADEAGRLGSPAPLVLDAASGYSFDRRVTGSWIQPSENRRGTHGHGPDRPEAHASLVISGALIRNRGTLGVVPMTRIAPTVAAILGLTLAPEADEPIPLDLETTAAR